jgi:ubiquinone/menaquinone biosynthesis C-methylase UbiE
MMFARFARRKAAHDQPTNPLLAENVYESLYEAHGAALSEADSVGGGDFDLIGRIELGLLQMEGLRPTDTVVDFGCGAARLASHLVPELNGGRYIGVDIAQSMLDKAARVLAQRIPSPPCSVSWLKQTTDDFSLDDASVDLMCAFSVFTHMEHEDSYRYLKSALRVVRRGGKLIFSCLPLEYSVARQIFVESAEQPLHERWSQVRNVTTSRDLMEAISELAGWEVIRWYSGDAPNVEVGEERYALGQSTCVLQRG